MENLKVTFIPKAGKPSHTKPNDFRPISLSSFVLKTFERTLDVIIKRSLNPKEISQNQHTYTKGKSRETELHSLVIRLEKFLDANDYSLVTFVGIEGAFNNIDLNCILFELERLGIEEPLRKVIEQLLQKRTIIASMGNSTIELQAIKGTPQGGVLSPLLWNIAVNDLLRKLVFEGCKVVAYADD